MNFKGVKMLTLPGQWPQIFRDVAETSGVGAAAVYETQQQQQQQQHQLSPEQQEVRDQQAQWDRDYL